MLGDQRIRALAGSIAVTGKVEDGDLVAVASAVQHLGMAQRVHGVVVAGTPMLRHGQPGKLIVFRVTFEASRSIDEVHEVVGVAAIEARNLASSLCLNSSGSWSRSVATEYSPWRVPCD